MLATPLLGLAASGSGGGIAPLGAEPGSIAVGAPDSAPMAGPPSPGSGGSGKPEGGREQLRPCRAIGPGAGGAPLRLAVVARSVAAGGQPLLGGPGPHDGRPLLAEAAAAEPGAGRASP